MASERRGCWKIGDRVQWGTDRTSTFFDVGTVEDVRASGSVVVRWDVAAASWDEDPSDLLAEGSVRK